MREKHVFQFKITLLDLTPPVWRQIQVPSSYSFWDLHVAIQDAMGWTDTHLHFFEVLDASLGEWVEFGIPDRGDDTGLLPGWDYMIRDYLSSEGASVIYEYDFGDSWRHAVTLEAILPTDQKRRYPICLGGARRCPPEDCGGVWGYKDFLEAITNPSHEEHADMLEWIGGSFDPEDFDPARVRFDDPQERRDFVLY